LNGTTPGAQAYLWNTGETAAQIEIVEPGEYILTATNAIGSSSDTILIAFSPVPQANAGADTINTVKQAAEFGITRRGVKLAALLMFLPDVHALGLQTAQGLVCTETFYWDLNDRTRAFFRRAQAVAGQVAVGMSHAGDYSGTLHYLKAVADLGVQAAKASGVATVQRMKALPTDDDAFGRGTIRADGRKIHPAYLFEVKKPEESRGPFDYYKLLQTTPADEAFRSIADGGCAFVRS
jgi:branched-chain amino acid transport system substrate-binding protein